jgi:hypothetical protein
MWHRRYVDWNRRTLFGRPEQGKGIEVDFADQSAIYGLYSAAQECVYIGQAGKGESVCLYDRLKTHALDDHLFCFWERFTWFGFYSPEQLRNGDFDDPIATTVTLSDALSILESVGIYLALPRFNRRWGTDFDKVAWYYQEAEYRQHMKANSSPGEGA